jgi:cytoskeletal protein RodZ
MEHITTDIGSRIRHAREQRGLTIRDIANTTKISTAALNAIEHNDFARLPGGVSRSAYVRAFATEVGLDADELTREYRSRFEIETPAGPIPPQKADWSDRVPALYRLGIVLVTVAMLIGAVVIQQRAQIPHESQDERSTLSAVETDLPEDTVPTNDGVPRKRSPSRTRPSARRARRRCGWRFDSMDHAGSPPSQTESVWSIA